MSEEVSVHPDQARLRPQEGDPTLRALLEKVRTATPGSLEVEQLVATEVADGFYSTDHGGGWIVPGITGLNPYPPGYTESVDAVLALIERKLPGSQAEMYAGSNLKRKRAFLYAPGHAVTWGQTRSLPLSLLEALLKMLLAGPLRHNARDGSSPQSEPIPGAEA